MLEKKKKYKWKRKSDEKSNGKISTKVKNRQFTQEVPKIKNKHILINNKIIK